MGMLLNGKWTQDSDVAATDPDGQWRRAPSAFRNWVTDDGRPGPTGTGGFRPETDRYHLYVAWNCPWAHRALLGRALLGLEDVLPVSFVAPRRTDQGWVFAPSDGYADALFDAQVLHEVYTRAEAGYSGRVTVPLLWDRHSERAVSNESADILRMMSTVFCALGKTPRQLYPDETAEEINAWNTRIHAGLNNGVYRAGFATSQTAYDEAVTEVFATLDTLEETLAQRPYLTGDALSEADLRLIPTLVRFDVAYVQAFKCARNRLIDFEALWAYARCLYHLPGVADTVRFDIYRAGYNSPNPNRNPLGIVPIAPDIDWSLP